MNGKPNPEKRMLGKEQMEWLKNSLLHSFATFKIVAVGSQVLNPVSPFDKWWDFPAEYDELMNFIKEYKISGVVFLTGDRHHSEIIKVDRPGHYPCMILLCRRLLQLVIHLVLRKKIILTV